MTSDKSVCIALTNQNRAFTLIELLIVIVIVGILSGIVIAVIDPIKQQGRARDAVVLSTLNKMGLSASGYLSAYGKSPSVPDFLDGIKQVSHSCSVIPTSSNCQFTVAGVSLPSSCGGGTTYRGNGTTACNFLYYTSSVGATPFQIIVKSWGQTNKTFIFNSSLGKVKVCSADNALLDMTGCTDY